jgi:hypothetical protein
MKSATLTGRRRAPRKEKMAHDVELEQKIRERAFQIWIEEGQPEGKDKEHWEKAKAAIENSNDAIGPSRGP